MRRPRSGDFVFPKSRHFILLALGAWLNETFQFNVMAAAAKQCLASTQYTQGSCMGMCPTSEVIRRQREKLVHPLESWSCAFLEPGKAVVAVPQRMVKEFSRSAADKEITAATVRPFPVLLKTVQYLVTEICSRTDVPWWRIYDFCLDRFRAVRQDLTVQGLTIPEVIPLLLAMVRFMLLSHYRLCDSPLDQHDPYLNLKQLREVLLTINKIKNEHGLPPVHLMPQGSTRTPSQTNLSHPEQSSSDESEEFFIIDEENDCDKGDVDSNKLNYRNHENENLHLECVESSVVPPPCVETATMTAQPVPGNRQVGTDCVLTETECTDTDSVATSASQNMEMTKEDKNKINISRELVGLEQRLDRLGISSGATHTSDVEEPFKHYSIWEELEAINLLTNLGSEETLADVLTLPLDIKNSPLVSAVYKAIVSWQTAGNYLPLFRLIPQLPPILACAVHIHLPVVQGRILAIMSVGYSCKNQRYKLADLAEHLLFADVDAAREACVHYGLEVIEGNVVFAKTTFNHQAEKLKAQKINLIDMKLGEELVSKLLMPGPLNLEKRSDV